MAADRSDRLAESIETLASAIEGNTQEIKALRDAIDDLRTEYVHAIRNAECPYLAEAKAVRRILPSFPLDDALEMDLTPEQVRQAVAEGVTTAVGLRRIEKNTRADEVPETIACAIATHALPSRSRPRSRRAGPTSAGTTGQAGTTSASAQTAKPRRAKRRKPNHRRSIPRRAFLRDPAAFCPNHCPRIWSLAVHCARRASAVV